MIYGLDDVRAGFDVACDAVVVGSGPGGAVAAANLAAAGLKTVLLEAGPAVGPEQMTRDAPTFMARYYWEAGMRLIGGSHQIPSLHARCLGGSSVVNSAIMLELPRWIREEWAAETGLDLFTGPLLDAAYARVWSRTGVGPTPMTVLGRRNLKVKEALEAVGIEGGPLPRAVIGCEGSGDCLTGCASGAKQSVDRSWLPGALADGAEVYTCAHVERVLTEGTRAVGVTGSVVDPRGRAPLAPFTVHAPRVFVAAGPAHTPVILQRSGIDPRGRVGATLFAHLGGGLVGIMEEVMEPWVGATQGWGAISPDIRGLKYESLWVAPSALMVRWGDVGRPFLEKLGEIKHATVVACVYRGKMTGRVKAKRDGMPSMKLWIPDSEAKPILRGMKTAADALFRVGARYLRTGMPGVPDEIRSAKEAEALLSPKLGIAHLQMTMNHVFGSCRMSRDDSRVVDEEGRVRGVDGLYLCDASVFPSPSAVNPQATIMALSDLISRRVAELPLA